MQFDFNVQANQSQHIDVTGSFVKYKSGAGLIRVRLNGGGYIDLLPGQGVNNVLFNSIDVQDRTGLQNAGTVLAGIYDFRDDRIAGQVEVIDGGRYRTNVGAAFGLHLYESPVVGGFSAVQLWNPPGSGKNLIVNQIQGTITNGFSIQLGFSNAALGGGVQVPGSKKAGGPASVAVGYYSAPVTQFLNSTVFAMSNGAILRLSEPFLLPPGWGLVGMAPATNNAVGLEVEYFEEPLL